MELSALAKVDILEKSLSAFRAEVDIKLKIMQQILSARNEQVNVQKNLLEKEEALYAALLSHWMETPQLAAATGFSVNFSNNIKEEVESDGFENLSEPDFREDEGDQFLSEPELRRKKSRSALRRQRSSAKTVPTLNDTFEAGNNYQSINPDEIQITNPSSSSRWEDDDDQEQILQNPPVLVQIHTEEMNGAEGETDELHGLQQPSVQKKIFGATENSWYDNLLGNWENRPNLSGSRLPLNFSVVMPNYIESGSGAFVTPSSDPLRNSVVDPSLSTLTDNPPPPGVSYTLWCPICSIKFNNRATKSDHMRGHRPGGRPRYQCRTCTQTFSKEGSRKRHQRKQNH